MHPSGSTAAAFADLQWLRSFAAVLAADADDADDLVQETLVAAWAKPVADTTTPLRPWLASVLRNRFRMLRRARARRDDREQLGESASASTAEPEREVERLEVLRILLAELEALPAEDRMIIVRRFFDGESAADIGRALAMPAATVRSRLHRSLKRLRGELDRRFEDRRTWCVALGLGPMGGAEQIANSTRGGEMSIIKGVVVAGALGGVASAGWVASRGPVQAMQGISAQAPASATVTASAQQRTWEERRAQIRRTLPKVGLVAAAPTSQDDADMRRHLAFRELVDRCLDDLESEASGALTIDVVEIGAPDVGVIYESIDVVEQTVHDPEVLQCIIESMYAFVGDPPAEGYARTSRRTMYVGDPIDEDAEARGAFDYVVGAHINEVRFCESKAKSPVAGELGMTVTIASDGKVSAAAAKPSELPAPVLDCVVNATKRWQFPVSIADRTLEYTFTLPIRPFPKPQ